jgi:hypothetical protein
MSGMLTTAAACAAVITALDSVAHRPQRNAFKVFVGSFLCVALVLYCMSAATGVAAPADLSAAALNNMLTGEPGF